MFNMLQRFMELKNNINFEGEHFILFTLQENRRLVREDLITMLKILDLTSATETEKKWT